MPATSPIARRSGAASLATMAAAAVALLAACAPGSPTAERSEDAAPPPTVDLSPEAGTVLTTIQAPVPVAATHRPDDDPARTTARRGDVGEVLLVGDSVLVLVLDDLAGRMQATLRVDGADCRRLAQAITGPCGGVPAGVEIASGLDAIATARAASGEPADAAVFVLANNSAITRSELDDAMAATEGIDHVWWVNTRIVGFGRQDRNNELLVELAQADPRAGIIDWHATSDGHDWLADNVHPNDDGQAALAALIEERVRCRCTA